MKKALAYVLALLCFFVPIGCSNQSEIENDSNAKQEETIAEETEEIEEAKTVNEEILYDKNESINLYLNKYNNLHPEAPITTDMFSTYHHHGTDHDDQILMYVDKAEIIISGGGLYTKEKSVSINIG